MKERRTPIERIPHLGFKQSKISPIPAFPEHPLRAFVPSAASSSSPVNLWKIYKAVEKLGAYELVTGRRLWKNVYDELGGSPGSTSAATCTRRHYERLVLPYVRHLKGEEDKPLPPAKPRRQYKGSKGGHESAEKTRRSKKEKSQQQVPADQAKADAVAAPEAGGDAPMDAPERRWLPEGPGSPVLACPELDRSPAETNQCLFSSLSAKGPRAVMSPLAKKKLLAQVSKEQALHCSKRHCPESQPTKPTASHWEECRSPEALRAVGHQSHLVPAPAIFTGCFHAYSPEVVAAPGHHTLQGHCCRSPEPGQSGEPAAGSRRGSCATLAAVQACWVPPSATLAPISTRDESFAFPAASRFSKEAEDQEKGAGHPLAKPKAVVATYTAPLVTGPPDGYKGEMLRLPLSAGSTPEHPAPVHPVLIPAFPRPLVAAPTQASRPPASGGGRYPYEGSLRHRLYAWPAQSVFYRHSAL
ncbi:ARI5A protein, partial [Nothocercus julius]|nr:ARI5A protein [Nothocercus julius]